MKYLYIFLFKLFFIVSCSAPVSIPYNTGLTEEERVGISKINIVSHIPQEQIDVEFIPTTGPDTGSLASPIMNSIMNKSRKRSNKEKLEFYRKLLSSYSFKENAYNNYLDVLSGEAWFKVAGFLKDSVYENFNPEDYTSDLDKEKVLSLSTNYCFDPEFNSIHVVLRAVLYMQAFYEEDTNDKKYKTKSWVIYHQSPSSVLKLEQKNQDEVAREIRELEKTYSEENLRKKSKSEKNFYRKALPGKIGDAKKKSYIKLPSHVSQFSWDRETMEKTLNFATKNAIKQLLHAMKNNLSEDDFREKSIILPVSYHKADPYLGLSFSSVNVYFLNEDPDNGYATYTTEGALTYTLPKKEVINNSFVYCGIEN